MESATQQAANLDGLVENLKSTCKTSTDADEGSESDNESDSSEDRKLGCGIPETQEYWLLLMCSFLIIALILIAPGGRGFIQALRNQLPSVASISALFAIAVLTISCTSMRFGAAVFTGEYSIALGNVIGVNENELKEDIVLQYSLLIAWIIPETT